MLPHLKGESEALVSNSYMPLEHSFLQRVVSQDGYTTCSDHSQVGG